MQVMTPVDKKKCKNPEIKDYVLQTSMKHYINRFEVILSYTLDHIDI